MLQLYNNPKSQYAQDIEGPSNPSQSLHPETTHKLNLISSEDRIQAKVIADQWSYLKVAIKKWPNPRTFVQLGDVHFFKKNYQRARRYYLNAIEIDDHYSTAYDRLIICLAALHDYQSINTYYKKWLEISNRSPRVLHSYILFRIVHEEMITDSVNNLLKDINEVIEKDKSNYSAIDTLGFMLLNIVGDIHAATKQFKKALLINPSYVHSINSLGICYLLSGKIESGLEQFYKVLQLNKSYVPAYENLASAYSQLDDKQSELNTLENAINNGIKLSVDWEHKIGWLKLQMGDFPEAINWYTNKIKEEKENNLLYNNLGICYLKMNEPRKAKGLFTKAISIFKSGKGAMDSRSMLAFYNLARVCLDLEEYSNVESVIDDLSHIDENNPFIGFLKGTLALRKRDYEKAKEFFEVLVENDTDIPDVYSDYGFVLECIDRDYEKAISVIKQGIKKGFRSHFALNNLAYAYIRSGEISKAESILQDIESELSGQVIATKGLLELRRGNLDKGNEYYQLAIKKLSDNEGLQTQAIQIWNYEQALYYFKNDNLKLSRKFLEKSMQQGDSYIKIDIDELNTKLSRLC